MPDTELIGERRRPPDLDGLEVLAMEYGCEVIDRVRVDEANRLKRDKPARKVIQSSRWLLLSNRENLTRREDRVRLSELLQRREPVSWTPELRRILLLHTDALNQLD